MKKKTLILLTALFVVLTTGCDKRTTGSKTVSYPAQAYTSLVCNCPIRISFSKEATEMVVTAEEHLLEAIRLDNNNGELVISIDHLNKQYWEEQPWVILPVPNNLSEITIYSMVTIDADTTITADEMEWEFSGAVRMDNFDLNVNKLNITSYSYGTDLHLSGQANEVFMELHSTAYNAFDLMAKQYECTLWSSTTNVYCTDLLRIQSANNSTLNYKGNCTVDSSEEVFSSSINHVE